MDFLPQCNRDVFGDFIPEVEKIDSGNKFVIILGGGFTAADCLGNINRQGAKRMFVSLSWSTWNRGLQYMKKPILTAEQTF